MSDLTINIVKVGDLKVFLTITNISKDSIGIDKPDSDGLHGWYVTIHDGYELRKVDINNNTNKIDTNIVIIKPNENITIVIDLHKVLVGPPLSGQRQANISYKGYNLTVDVPIGPWI